MMLKIIRLISLLFITFTMPFAYAQAAKPAEAPTKVIPENISLYQQPDIKSPVVSTLKPNQPIVFIFNQNDWSKIADPSNGNVGWVKNETLIQARIAYTNTVIQAINNPNSTGYKVIQYVGSSNPADQKQMEETMKKWETQRAEMQKVYNDIFQQNLQAVNQMTKELQNIDIQIPMLMPVLQPVVLTSKDIAEKAAQKTESEATLNQ